MLKRGGFRDSVVPAGASPARAETPAVRQNSSGASGRRQVQRLLRFVQLSSERTLEPVRQDSSFAKKQESPAARLVLVFYEVGRVVKWCGGRAPG
jgi:hypothetical protein